jgi:hypothetical protein
VIALCDVSTARVNIEDMAAVNLKSLDKHKLKEFIESFDVVLSDCDGA